jgi:hypothetical protein
MAVSCPLDYSFLLNALGWPSRNSFKPMARFPRVSPGLPVTIFQLMHFLIHRRILMSENDVTIGHRAKHGQWRDRSILMFGFVLECRVE